MSSFEPDIPFFFWVVARWAQRPFKLFRLPNPSENDFRPSLGIDSLSGIGGGALIALLIISSYLTGASLGLGVTGIVSALLTEISPSLFPSVPLVLLLGAKSFGVVGSGLDVMRVSVGIVAVDIVEHLCVVWERDVLYARFNFCRDGFRAFDKVREIDFFHAEEEVEVGVLGVMGVERSVGVRGGF